jgi:hypothetical protein
MDESSEELFSAKNTKVCPNAPVTGPSIPKFFPEDLHLPPAPKRSTTRSGEVRMLSEPNLATYLDENIESENGLSISPFSDFSGKSSLSSIVQSRYRALTDEELAMDHHLRSTHSDECSMFNPSDSNNNMIDDEATIFQMIGNGNSH